MFVTYNQVRMHDTDMVGILYFARQFRFAHDALEDFVASEGLSFNELFHGNAFVFVVVHVEADYLAPLHVGDALAIHVNMEKIGTTSFTMQYQIFKKINHELVGTVKMVHVTLDSHTRQKIPLPNPLRHILEKHLIQNYELKETKATK